VYAVIRHPRYVAFLLGVLGWSLMVNWGSAYLVWLVSVPAIWGVTVLEERELRERFGAPYDEYRARVPRFIPRRS
jgi:protein-S-isoprenylcysteine O-methyltransferase Ste14